VVKDVDQELVAVAATLILESLEDLVGPLGSRGLCGAEL
jgi:hypothetical protein